MHVDGHELRTIRFAEGGGVEVIDQTRLPHEMALVTWRSLDDAIWGIVNMQVRGAPLIGVAAAHAVALAMAADPSDDALGQALDRLTATRPTAVNLRWALDRMHLVLAAVPPAERAVDAARVARQLAEDDVAVCRALGDRGAALLHAAAAAPDHDGPVRVLTHCNAGWLAAVEWGTALAPVYVAHDAGLPVEVWVSETRPRNQGASLTCWELAAHGVPHRLVVDNAAGHLLATGAVDLCLVGADRVAANGDVANKIGTYLKALAAFANDVPFHVVAPTSTIDRSCPDGADIPIEERGAGEVLTVTGCDDLGVTEAVAIAPAGTVAANPAFDVTPAALVTSIVTEHGVVPADAAGLAGLPGGPS